MNKIKQCLLLFLLLSNLTLWCQKRSRSYFVVNHDTTFCKNLSFKVTIQGYLKQVNYKTLDGEKVEIIGTKNVPDVTTFCIRDSVLEKLPQKLSQPKRYIAYTYRVVGGKLNVYIEQQGMMRTSTGYVSTGTYRFFIRMPDGKLYKINNNKNKKGIIIPYLLKCKRFKNEYKGDLKFNANRFVNEENFIEMIRFYNSICD